MPNLHPREKVTMKAEVEINAALIAVTEKYDLTDGEVISYISGFLANRAKYMIRLERHGDINTPGGLE